jgi:hypothetical protein
MSDMIIRDPDAMVKFAGQIETYCDSMKRVCNALKSSLSSAAPLMKGDTSKKALQKITNLANDLMSGLPVAQGAADKLRAAAKPLIQAQAISM